MMNIIIKPVVAKQAVMAIFIGAMSLFGATVSAAESQYEIRADGLACPYCAYGIEKKFMAIKGVKHVDIKLKQGKVLVTGEESLKFAEPQLKTLFNDSGFTYRSLEKLSVDVKNQN